ncbi:MAG: hypothetical protein FWE37_03535 [Spirochaetaceae bacterium]|nr:hypothetical protein [Spirochaetaceae bacterium]
MKKIFFLILVVLASSSFGQSLEHISERLFLQRSGFIENYEIRQQLRHVIEATSFEAVDMPARLYRQATSGTNVELSVRRESESFNVIFANQLFSELATGFRAYNRGNYVFRKHITTGRLENIRIFLQSGAGSFIDVRPGTDGRSVMDVFLFNTPIYRNIPVPLGINVVALSPFARLIAVTNNNIDWRAIINDGGNAEQMRVAAMSAAIRPFLAELAARDTEDGAQNSAGNFIFINDGALQSSRAGGLDGFNCSGFVKWVADGLILPLTGRLLDPEILKIQPPISERAFSPALNFPERDPFFGLDWTRNLAHEIRRAQFPQARNRLGQSDVNDTPFTAFLRDIGYSLAQLELVLYLETIRNPGHFYFGSINQEFGSNPVLRQHIHTAVFFPYFNEQGEFVIEMYERNWQTNPDSLRSRYSGAFVFLSRVRASDNFRLPAI